MTLHVSGSPSAHHQEFLAVRWLWYILCRSDGRCYQEQDGTACNNTNNANKIGTQCVCWFYSQGICQDARSYDLKIDRFSCRNQYSNRITQKTARRLAINAFPPKSTECLKCLYWNENMATAGTGAVLYIKSN